MTKHKVMAAAAINLAIDFLLIKRIGITAGSLSTLVAYIALYVFRTVDSRKFQPIKYHVKKQIGLFALIAVMLVMCFMKNFYLNCINMVVGIATFVILNKDLMQTFLLHAKHLAVRKKD